MSKDDAKADLTSLQDAVSEDHKPSSAMIEVAVAEIKAAADDVEEVILKARKIMGVESPAEAEEADSSLSPETTSSDLSNDEDTPGETSDADVASLSIKAEASSVDTSAAHTAPNVCFASEVTGISASEDNESFGDNDLVRDSAVAGPSGEPTEESAILGGSENSVERSSEIPNWSCCPEHRGIIGYFRISMMYLRESKYLLPFQFLMLSMPVSCGFMSAKYMEKCPASSAIPLLLFMMGVFGTVVICSRIYSIFKKALFPHSDWAGQVRSALVACILMLIVLYTAELACFFNATPTFTHGSEDYCDETFYYFVACMNYISIPLVIILLLLHIPGSIFLAAIRNPRIILG